jgi:hypothetical protein
MPIFDDDSSPGFWLPSPLAAGPFSGLQGGAIAGLLTAEVEARAAERRWGTAISVSEAPPLPQQRSEAADPTCFPARKVASFHGRPWMMDAMEARAGDGIAWFRQTVPMIAAAPAHTLSSVVGAADWAHGIARPLQNVLADPNPNLTVHLLRPRQGDWVGIRAHASWDTQRGLGIGGGAVLDVHGEIGSVSMAVALVPFPKQTTARVADRATA